MYSRAEQGSADMKTTISLSLILALVLLVALAVSPACGQTPSQTPGQGRAGEVVPDSYIVVLKDGVSPDQVVKETGARRNIPTNRCSTGSRAKFPPDN